jgi:FeS assembly protein IscX
MLKSDGGEPQQDHYPLVWDASYEIVLALMDVYPKMDLSQLGLAQLKAMIVTLPAFADDPSLAHDGLLTSILREWYEETDTEGFASL